MLHQMTHFITVIVSVLVLSFVMLSFFTYHDFNVKLLHFAAMNNLFWSFKMI
jgi:hypothetical protein